MSSSGHRKPRGRSQRKPQTTASDGVPPLAETVASAIAPAEVESDSDLVPLDHDGLVPIAVITALWGIAAVVLFLMRDDLADHDQTWWLWTCVAGFGLGLLGYAYSRRRRDALRANA
jgi:hypothetical protein